MSDNNTSEPTDPEKLRRERDWLLADIDPSPLIEERRREREMNAQWDANREAEKRTLDRMAEQHQQRREWKPGDTIGPQDFGITPAAPNPLGDAVKRDLARRAEEMQDEGDGPVSSEETST